MKSKLKTKNTSMMTGIMIGLSIAISVSIILTLALTSIILNGSIADTNINVFVFFIRALSVLAACMISALLIGRKHLLVVGITAASYLIILIGVAIVLYNGAFHNFLNGLLSVCLGAGITCVIKLKAPKKARRIQKQRR